MNKNTQGVNNGLSVVLEQIYRIMLQYLLLFLFSLVLAGKKTNRGKINHIYIFYTQPIHTKKMVKAMKHQTKPTFFVTYTLLCYKTIIKREN